MTIRPAIPADLELLAPLAREFYASSRLLSGFDLDRFRAFWRSMLAGPGVILLLEDGGAAVGALGGICYPEPYSGALVATEFFWFVTAGRRGGGIHLYRAWESWARERGCSQVRMAHLADVMPERMAVVYRRLGYEPAETQWVKEIA